MRYGIFGDVHSNLEAFTEVIKAYKNEGIDRYLCVGDIVGYGADPMRCIESLKNLDAEVVCGNHDWATADIFDIEYFNPTAKKAIEWTKKVLGEVEKQFLRSQTLILKEMDFIIVHGTLHRSEDFLYLFDLQAARASFDLMDRPILFVGHTHTPVIFFQVKSRTSLTERSDVSDKCEFYPEDATNRSIRRNSYNFPYYQEDSSIDYTFKDCLGLKEGMRYIVNVGSVGQPRDGDPRAAYCIYDTDKKRVWIRRLKYDVEKTKEKILKAGLPEVLGYRLLEGR